jgi:hypothetical protein
MAKTKKNTQKTDELPNPQVNTPQTETSVECIESEAPVATPEAKPVIQSDQDIIRELQETNKALIDLISDVPKPEFFKFEDAVSYQDKWAKWNETRRLTWNRLNL